MSNLMIKHALLEHGNNFFCSISFKISNCCDSKSNACVLSSDDAPKGQGTVLII